MNELHFALTKIFCLFVCLSHFRPSFVFTDVHLDAEINIQHLKKALATFLLSYINNSQSKAYQFLERTDEIFKLEMDDGNEIHSPYLSDRQISELHKSILQYLISKVFSSNSQDNDANSIADESTQNELLGILLRRLTGFDNLDEFQKNAANTIPENFLEKKWSAVLNLQKKVFELEKELENQKKIVKEYDTFLEENDSEMDGGLKRMKRSKYNWIPRAVRTTLRYHHDSVTSIAIHPFNPILATAGQDGSIVIWNLLDLSEPEKVIRNAHSRAINCLCFQPISRSKDAKNSAKKPILLASASSDLLIKLWNIRSETFNVPVSTLSSHEHLVSRIAFSRSDTSQLVSCSRDKTIKVWDVSSGWCTKTIRGHSDWVRGVDLCSSLEDGDFILSCSNDQSVRLTHLDSGNGVGLCIGHKQVVEDAIFIPDSRELDLADDSSDVDNDAYRRLGYKYCASCGRDNTIKIWRLPLPDMTSGTPRPCANPQGKLLFEIDGHTTWVRRLRIHPNGKYLVSCSDDKTIKFWDLHKIAVACKDDIPAVSPSAVLKDHDSFVNVIAFADPVLPPKYYEYLHSSDDKDQLKAKRLLEQGMRCYLVSGSSDSTVKVWV